MTRTEHLLFILAEECAEVAHRASKAARFGLNEIQPGQPFSNSERIVAELLDLKAVVEMLRREGCFTADQLEALIPVAAKMEKVEHYLNLSQRCGTLDSSTEASVALNERTQERDGGRRYLQMLAERLGVPLDGAHDANPGERILLAVETLQEERDSAGAKAAALAARTLREAARLACDHDIGEDAGADRALDTLADKLRSRADTIEKEKP